MKSTFNLIGFVICIIVAIALNACGRGEAVTYKHLQPAPRDKETSFTKYNMVVGQDVATIKTISLRSGKEVESTIKVNSGQNINLDTYLTKNLLYDKYGNLLEIFPKTVQ